MKLHIKFFSIALVALFFISCQTKKGDKIETEAAKEQTLVAQDLHEIRVDIKGMTCEIGCAKLIQSKLYKADGVSFAKVSFEDSSGIVKFDKNRINENDIKKVIESAAGGNVYAVIGMEELDLTEVNSDIN